MEVSCIYRSLQREKEYNTEYKTMVIFNDFETLRNAVQYDHIAPRMKDMKRGQDNFIECKCIMMDLDNTHSEDPDTWRTLDDIQDTFPDVSFYYVHSRNYMKVKTKVNKKTGQVTQYEPREKYHLYFPLRQMITDRESCKNLMLKIAALFPYFDLGAAKPEQFFYGVENPTGGTVEGELTIDEFMETVPDDVLIKEVNSYCERIKSGEFTTSDEIEKAVSQLCNLLKIDNPLKPDETPTKKEKKGFVEALGEDLDWLRHADQDNSLDWFNRWADSHDIERGKMRRATVGNHEDALIIPVPCPGEDDHTSEGSKTSSVVIIDLDGTLNYKCSHTHCKIKGWKKYRACYDPPEELEKVENELTTSENRVYVLDDQQVTKHRANVEVNKQGFAYKKRTNYDIVLSEDGNFLDESGKSIFSYNMLDGLIYVTGAAWNLTPHTFNPIDESEVQKILSARYWLESVPLIYQALRSVAFKNKFHPVRDKLEALRGSWDGVERLKDFFPHFLGAERSEYTTAVTILTFHGIIQRVMNPACKFDYCPVVKSPQGAGKSTLIRFLALDDCYFTDDLKDMGKDSAFEKIRGKVVVELGEMLFTRKTKQIEAIKSFLSRKVDSYREPYTRTSVDYYRQCVFIGTTNKSDFLPDDKTGNRRFIPIICEGKAEVHPLDDEKATREYINQCYAEALAIGDSDGYMLVLPPEIQSQVDALNETATPEDWKIGFIQEKLDRCPVGEVVCTRSIFTTWIDHWNNPTRYELQDIAEIMNNKIKGWKKYPTKDSQYRFKEYGKQRAWVKVLSTEEENSALAVDNLTGAVDSFTPIETTGETSPFEDLSTDAPKN